MPIDTTIERTPVQQTAAEMTAAAQALVDKQQRDEFQRTRDEVLELTRQYAERARAASGREFSFPPQTTDYFSNGEPEYARIVVRRPNQEEETITVPLGYYSEADRPRLAALMPDGTAFPLSGSWGRVSVDIVSMADTSGARHELVSGIASDERSKYNYNRLDRGDYSSITLSDGTNVQYDYFDLPRSGEELRGLRDSLKRTLDAESPQRPVVEGQTSSEKYQAELAEAARIANEQFEATGREIESISKQFLRRAETANGVKLEPGTAEHAIQEANWTYRYEYVPEYATIRIFDPDGSVRTYSQPLALVDGDRRQPVVVMADGSIHRLSGSWGRYELSTVSEPDVKRQRYELVPGISVDQKAAIHRDLIPASTVYKGGHISEPGLELSDGRKIQYFWSELPDDLEGRQELRAGLSSTWKGKETTTS